MNSVAPPAQCAKSQVGILPKNRRFIPVPQSFEIDFFAPQSVFDHEPAIFLHAPTVRFGDLDDNGPDGFMTRDEAINIIAEKNAPTLAWLRAWNGNDTTWPAKDREDVYWWMVLEVTAEPAFVFSQYDNDMLNVTFNYDVKFVEASDIERRMFPPEPAEYARRRNVVIIPTDAYFQPGTWFEQPAVIPEHCEILKTDLPLDEALDIVREFNFHPSRGNQWAMVTAAVNAPAVNHDLGSAGHQEPLAVEGGVA